MSIFAGGLSSGRGRKSFKPQQRGPYEGSTQPGRHRPKVARPFRTARDCRFHRARSPVSAPSTCRSPLPSACSLRKSENRTAGKGKGCRRICPPKPTPRRGTVIRSSISRCRVHKQRHLAFFLYAESFVYSSLLGGG